MKERKKPDALHFASIALENVRAFGSFQKLDLTDEDGRPRRWCLILGENGVGKTTLMQSLALMRPIPASASSSSTDDAGPPTLSQPEITDSQNDELQRFVRAGTGTRTSMQATLQDQRGEELTVGIVMQTKAGEITKVRRQLAKYPLESEGPLILGYGAARHVGHSNKSTVAERPPVWSLFSDAVDLYDAEELLEQLDHAARSGPKDLRARDRSRLRAVVKAVAALLDSRESKDIQFKGPRVPGRKPSEYGVHVSTPSGLMPLSELSLGYQSVFAWTVDLAYRLIEAFPDSEDPMSESAIVLVDEIDLHLHPRWQRDLRRRLASHFPNVQFIATTHSPITAQEAVAEGARVAVVRWKGVEAEIFNNPIASTDWRLDQLMTSKLFDFRVSRSVEAEEKMTRRLELIRKGERRTARDNKELEALNAFVHQLPAVRSKSEIEFEELMSSYLPPAAVA